MSKVYITGVGCITPIGNNIETLWNNLMAGHCGIDFITKLDTTDLPVKVAAEVKDFHPENYGIDKNMIRHNDIYALYALEKDELLRESTRSEYESLDFNKLVSFAAAERSFTNLK